jgi:hypothetical protein
VATPNHHPLRSEWDDQLATKDFALLQSVVRRMLAGRRRRVLAGRHRVGGSTIAVDGAMYPNGRRHCDGVWTTAVHRTMYRDAAWET